MWRQLAYGAHHDAITGSEPDQVYIDLVTGWREAHDLAAEARDAALTAIFGEVRTLDGAADGGVLPGPLAAELRAVPAGVRVGPVRSGLGWHIATIVATEVRADPQPGQGRAAALDPPRLAAFNRWLDERRRALVRYAPGFEHPGDPAQPDNTRRH